MATCLSEYFSPFGRLWISTDETRLTGLWFEGQRYFGSTLPAQVERKIQPVAYEVYRWLDAYFSGEIPSFLPPLNLSGTAFRQEIWKKLLEIPYGKTVTYGDIARQIAGERGLARFSAQAVGNAVGHNPVSIIVPCHRVVGSRGQLVGYAAGTDVKSNLLRMEEENLLAYQRRVTSCQSKAL